MEHIRVYLKEYIKKIDSVISGKLFRLFIRFLSEWGSKGEEGLDTTSVSRVMTLGRAKIIFQGNFDPAGAPMSEEKGGKNPRILETYLKYFEKAQALLEKKGLGEVWYGNFFVRCKSCGGANRLGPKWNVGADYSPSEDDVRMYDDPHEGLERLIIHELGHRFYFRFMDQGDRARFDSYFKEVPATTEYGGSDTWEDFADLPIAPMGHEEGPS